jgi:hypothetical protein
MKHLNSPVTCNKIEAVIKSPYKEEHRTWWIHGQIYQTFKELIPILLKFFQEIEREGTLPNSSYDVNITLIPKITLISKKTSEKRIIYQYL